MDKEQRLEGLAEASDSIEDNIQMLGKLPPSREVSLVITKLQEAKMWTAAAIKSVYAE